MLRVGMSLVLLGLVPVVGRADVIIGNLGAASGGSSRISPIIFLGASFTMGSQSYTLSGAKIVLANTPVRETNFRLESDSAGDPSGTVLSKFTNPPFGSGITTYMFTPSSPFTLAANTKYWLVGSTNGADTSWVTTSPNTDPSGPGATFGGYSFSSSSGANWSNIGFTTQFQIEGTPIVPAVVVPEPSSLVLVGIVACVAMVVGWHRRRKLAK